MINTGDNLAGFDAVPGTLKALDPLMDRPGAFVLASNDYYAPRPKNPLKYFWPDHKRVHGDAAAVARPARRHARPRLARPHQRRRRAHRRRTADRLRRRRRLRTSSGTATTRSPGRPTPTADVRIGLAHSPEPRVLDRFAADGYDLLLCGHTHGGQLRVPFYGALVTNCGIDRERVRWLHRWTGPGHLAARLGGPGHQPVRARSASPARPRRRCSP